MAGVAAFSPEKRMAMASDSGDLAEFLILAIRKFFEDPAVREDFERWKRERAETHALESNVSAGARPQGAALVERIPQ